MEFYHVALCVSLTVVLLLGADALPAAPANATPTACESYDYCQGENFPRRVKVADLAIHCRDEPSPRDHCCLPYAPHYVCYDITVEGDSLNFDEEDSSKATDFAALCLAMVESLGKKGGRHNAATKAPGGGKIAFINGLWVDKVGSKHLRHVACEVQEPDLD